MTNFIIGQSAKSKLGNSNFNILRNLEVAQTSTHPGVPWHHGFTMFSGGLSKPIMMAYERILIHPGFATLRCKKEKVPRIFLPFFSVVEKWWWIQCTKGGFMVMDPWWNPQKNSPWETNPRIGTWVGCHPPHQKVTPSRVNETPSHPHQSRMYSGPRPNDAPFSRASKFKPACSSPQVSMAWCSYPHVVDRYDCYLVGGWTNPSEKS